MEQQIIVKKNWFKEWFNTEFYHRLYAHRDEGEAAGFIDNLIHELNPKQRATMLDLGCGSGRHAKRLASKGFNVTGLDLAYSSILVAKKSEAENLRFHKHDMRDAFGTNCFDYVFNFFTSFGYFTAEENQHVMRHICNSLKVGGHVVIDYMNTHYAEKRLVSKDEKEIDGIIYHLTRWMDNKHFYKSIEIDALQAGERFSYIEKVAKLNLEDFKILFESNGLQLQNVYGDYGLKAYDQEKSPRLLLVAKKGN